MSWEGGQILTVTASGLPFEARPGEDHRRNTAWRPPERRASVLSSTPGLEIPKVVCPNNQISGVAGAEPFQQISSVECHGRDTGPEALSGFLAGVPLRDELQHLALPEGKLTGHR
jgi:hypothetical protein